MRRHDGRRHDEIRSVKIRRGFTKSAPGSVLIQAGRTTVLCTASVEPRVPPWLEGSGKGWVTAEYNMLPGSTSPRKARDRGGRPDGRTSEIQRLVGRSLRAVVDLDALGQQLITVDCDVLEADGGTRTLSVTGAFVALVDALRGIQPSLTLGRQVVRDSIAAVSVGLIDNRPVLDLDYHEDSAATVDMNVVMTGRGQYVELQGTGEESTFSDDQLARMLKLARGGIDELTRIQREKLGKHWPLPR
jgi:ribonuclease PH